jgi:DNA-binding NarL/FixJ family response regulator
LRRGAWVTRAPQDDRGASRSRTAARDRIDLEQDLIAGRANAGNDRVVEQPSAAELAVLRCLATALLRREIGAKLYISLATI